jgi:hypothetical protein
MCIDTRSQSSKSRQLLRHISLFPETQAYSPARSSHLLVSTPATPCTGPFSKALVLFFSLLFKSSPAQFRL